MMGCLWAQQRHHVPPEQTMLLTLQKPRQTDQKPQIVAHSASILCVSCFSAICDKPYENDNHNKIPNTNSYSGTWHSCIYCIN